MQDRVRLLRIGAKSPVKVTRPADVPATMYVPEANEYLPPQQQGSRQEGPSENPTQECRWALQMSMWYYTATSEYQVTTPLHADA